MRSRWLVSSLLLLLPLSAHAEAPPLWLGDLYGYEHQGFDRVTQMACRDDGRIYLADAFHNRIVVYREDGQYLEQIGSLGDALGEFNLPHGLAFDGDGNLYVAEQGSDRITKLSPTHLPLLTFGGSGSGPGQLREPTNLAVSADGTQLYVTEKANHRVSMFALTGAYLGSFGGPGTGPGQLDHPFGIAVDATGDVFVADQVNNRVQRFDADGHYEAQFGSDGSAPGQFHYVVGLAVDAAGDVYATDQLNNRVQKLTRDGAPLTAWGSFGSGPGQMYNPWSVLALPSGRIWVGDTYNYRISVYGPAGAGPVAAAPASPGAPALGGAAPAGGSAPSVEAALIGCLAPAPRHAFDLRGFVHGGFDRVPQMARRSDGRIYVADAFHQRLVVYLENGQYLEQIGMGGSDLGEFDLPHGVVFDGDGNLYVAEQAGDRITKLSPTHLPLMTIGSSGGGPGQLLDPTNLALSADGTRLYVTEEYANARVSMFDLQGVPLGTFGSLGSGPGQFNHPYGIAVDATGDVFVADQVNNRVQRFDADGHYEAQFGSDGSAPGQFHYVVGLAVDAAGDVYATDQLNNRVQKLTRDGAPLTAWGSFGSGPGQMYNPWSVLALPSGRIWVGDTYNYRISVYGPELSSPSPDLLSVLDIPEDEGHQVRLRFAASSRDVAGSPTPVLQYEAFRRIDAPAAATAPARAAERPLGMQSDVGVLLAGWEFVGAVPAHAEPEYSMIAPTLVDARRGAPRYSVFFVRAATAQPAVYFDSCPDSGYSVDNRAPSSPRSFRVVGRSADGVLLLDWDPNTEPDLDHYSLFRGLEPDFVPSAESKLADSQQDQYADGTAPGEGPVYYRLAAEDEAGNVSAYATASSEGVVGVPGGELPAAFALHAPVPNPVRDRTRMSFDLPVRSVVTLRIFDSRGRAVRALEDGTVLAAGRYERQWDGRDAGGSAVPAGVYFCRLDTPHFSQSRRVVVLESR